LGLQTKLVVYAAVAGLLVMMGAIVWYASLDNPALEQVEIELTNVEVTSVNKIENTAELQVTFLIKNPSEKTFTVPLINYEFYADGELLGSGQYSTGDIAMTGRAIFSSGVEIPLSNTFDLTKSEVKDEIYQAVLDDKISSFRAEGILTTETAWSLIEKEFVTAT
jgi:LEA14-like dessication related protein